jgi:GNAT superfamily N-acetyltransferase
MSDSPLSHRGYPLGDEPLDQLEPKMNSEPNLYYFCTPRTEQTVDLPVEFVSVQEFVDDETACRTLWDLVSANFRTRGKFLNIWPNVRYVAIVRNEDGQVDGLLLVSAPINWQIDYVVTRPEARGRGVATVLVKTALNYAARLNVPYVMLTSKESLRPLYESCGFAVVNGVECVA